MELLRYIGAGLLNKQVAGELGVSHQTVKNHVGRVTGKLKANNRAHAVAIALRRGLLILGRV